MMSSKHLKQALLALALSSLSLSTPIPTRDPGSALGPGETLDNQTPAFDVRYVGDGLHSAGAASSIPGKKHSRGEEPNTSADENQTPAIDIAARAPITVGQGGPNAIQNPDDMERANVIVAPGVRRDQNWYSLDGAAAPFDSRGRIDQHKRTDDGEGGISFRIASRDMEQDLPRTSVDLDPHDGFQKERRKKDRGEAATAEVTLDNPLSGAYRHARRNKAQEKRFDNGPSPYNATHTIRSSRLDEGLGKSKRSAQSSQDGWTGYPDTVTTDQHGSMDDKRHKQRGLTKGDGSEWYSIDTDSGNSGKEARRGSEQPDGNDDTQGHIFLERKRKSPAELDERCCASDEKRSHPRDVEPARGSEARPTRSLPERGSTDGIDENGNGDIIWLTRARTSRSSDGNVDVQTKDKRTAEEEKNRESGQGELDSDGFGWGRKRGRVPVAKSSVIRRPGSTLEGPMAMARRTRDPDEVPEVSYNRWVSRREEPYGRDESAAGQESKRVAGAPVLGRRSVTDWDNMYPGNPTGLDRETDDYQGKGTNSAIPGDPSDS